MIPFFVESIFSSFEVGWFAWQHAFSVLWKEESADDTLQKHVTSLPNFYSWHLSPSEGSHQDKYRQMLKSFLLIQHTILHANRMPKRIFPLSTSGGFSTTNADCVPFEYALGNRICLRAWKSNKTLCSSWWGCPTTCCWTLLHNNAFIPNILINRNNKMPLGAPSGCITSQLAMSWIPTQSMTFSSITIFGHLLLLMEDLRVNFSRERNTPLSWKIPQKTWPRKVNPQIATNLETENLHDSVWKQRGLGIICWQAWLCTKKRKRKPEATSSFDNIQPSSHYTFLKTLPFSQQNIFPTPRRFPKKQKTPGSWGSRIVEILLHCHLPTPGTNREHIPRRSSGVNSNSGCKCYWHGYKYRFSEIIMTNNDRYSTPKKYSIGIHSSKLRS